MGFVCFPLPAPRSPFPSMLSHLSTCFQHTKSEHVHRYLICAWNHDRNIIDTSLKAFCTSTRFPVVNSFEIRLSARDGARRARGLMVEMARRRFDAPTATTQWKSFIDVNPKQIIGNTCEDTSTSNERLLNKWALRWPRCARVHSTRCLLKANNRRGAYRTAHYLQAARKGSARNRGRWLGWRSMNIAHAVAVIVTKAWLW